MSPSSEVPENNASPAQQPAQLEPTASEGAQNQQPQDAPQSPQRGEVWRVELDPTLGSEQSKARPVVVLSHEGIGRVSMRLCAPITGRLPVHGRLFWCVPLAPHSENGLTKPSSIDTAQTRALDMVRFIEKIGVLNDVETDAAASALALCARSDSRKYLRVKNDA